MPTLGGRPARGRRLARLERENRWFKRLASVGFLGLVTLFLMGQARPARAPDAIEAKSFVVRDGNGQQRAKLSVEPTSRPPASHQEDEAPSS